MDFNDTPEQAAFRSEVRNWLDANAPKKQAGENRVMEADPIKSYEDARAWYKKVAAAGFAGLTWPKEYGGAGLSAIHNVIWSQEVANYHTKDGFFVIGIVPIGVIRAC